MHRQETNPKRLECIREAYAILNNTTPLSVDCGSLCGSCCCHVEDSGMLLLPGEAEILQDEPGYTFLPYDLPEKENQAAASESADLLLLCSGTCRRTMRPFACRIFPLYPLLRPSAKVKDGIALHLILDPRAYGLCPLTLVHFPLRGIFRHLVRQATRVLLQDDLLRAWMLEDSEHIAAMESLRLRLTVP